VQLGDVVVIVVVAALAAERLLELAQALATRW